MLLVRVPLIFLYFHIVTVVAAPAGKGGLIQGAVKHGSKGALRPITQSGSHRLPSASRVRVSINKSSVNFVPAKYYSTLPPAAQKAPNDEQLKETVKAAYKQQNSENTSKAKDKWRIDPECVAAAWYAARQAVIIGGSAMLAEMMPGGIVGVTQSFIGAWMDITAAADESLGEKLQIMPEFAALRILEQNHVRYKKKMTHEEIIQFIDDMIEKAEAVKNDIEAYKVEEDGVGEVGDTKGKSEDSADEEATETKSESARRNGISMIKRTSLQPRAFSHTINGLCENIVPRVNSFKRAQQSILKLKGVRGALVSRISVLAKTCPIGWVAGAVTKGVGELIGGMTSGTWAAQKEAAQKEAAAKAKADALKEKESSQSDETERTERRRETTSHLESRGTIVVLACVPVIGGLFAGAAVENGIADDFWKELQIEKYEALVDILVEADVLKRFTVYERGLLALFVRSYDSEMRP